MLPYPPFSPHPPIFSSLNCVQSIPPYIQSILPNNCKAILLYLCRYTAEQMSWALQVRIAKTCRLSTDSIGAQITYNIALLAMYYMLALYFKHGAKKIEPIVHCCKHNATRAVLLELCAMLCNCIVFDKTHFQGQLRCFVVKL